MGIYRCEGGLLIRERAPAEFLAIDFRHHSLPFLETAIRAGRSHALPQAQMVAPDPILFILFPQSHCYI